MIVSGKYLESDHGHPERPNARINARVAAYRDVDAQPEAASGELLFRTLQHRRYVARLSVDQGAVQSRFRHTRERQRQPVDLDDGGTGSLQPPQALGLREPTGDPFDDLGGPHDAQVRTAARSWSWAAASFSQISRSPGSLTRNSGRAVASASVAPSAIRASMPAP